MIWTLDQKMFLLSAYFSLIHKILIPFPEHISKYYLAPKNIISYDKSLFTMINTDLLMLVLFLQAWLWYTCWCVTLSLPCCGGSAGLVAVNLMYCGGGWGRRWGGWSCKLHQPLWYILQSLVNVKHIPLIACIQLGPQCSAQWCQYKK